MKTKDFNVQSDAHGDLLLVCPKGHYVTVNSGLSITELLALSMTHLKDVHGQ